MNYNNLLLLLKENKYDEVKNKCKALLQEDSENAELWYTLFLAENENYIDTDFNSIKDEMAFNQAISYANYNEKKQYLSEYNFYKFFPNIKYIRELFRYAQLEDIENFKNILDLVDDSKQQLIIEDKEEFYSNLDYIIFKNKNLNS